MDLQLKNYLGDWLRVMDVGLLEETLEKLETLTNITPNKLSTIFRAFHLCSLHNCKVIIIGQEPYYQKNIATGIAFANSKNTEESQLSTSLVRLEEAIEDLYNKDISCNFDPSLEDWEKQGILLLNSALTVEVNKPSSHVLIWYKFIHAFVKHLSVWEPGLIYVLLGTEAKSFKKDIKYGYIIEDHHPSYYTRINKRMSPKIFLEVNKLMKFKYNTQINWINEN